MSQKSLAQWLGNLLSATTLALLYLASLVRLWAQHWIAGLSLSPQDCWEFLSWFNVLLTEQRICLGLTIACWLTADLSSDEFALRSCPNWSFLNVMSSVASNRSFERGFFLRKISRSNTIRYVRKSSLSTTSSRGSVRLIVQVFNYQLCLSCRSRQNDISSR